MKLSEAFELYEMDKKILGYSKHTLSAYGIQLNLLIKYLGDDTIEDVTYVKLKQYLAKDAERLKPSSLGHRIRFIRSLFRYLHEEGHLDTNPASRLKEPKEGRRVPKFLPEEEIEMLREACLTQYEKSLINLMYASGCRVGEIHLMNRNHINWENRSIIVLGKNNKEREVYFDTKTSLHLKRYLESREDDCEALFVTERKPHRRTSIWQLRHVVKRIAKRTDIESSVYCHRFRHSFATHLYNKGLDLSVISSLAGHSSTNVTKIYADLSGDRRRELYRKYF